MAGLQTQDEHAGGVIEDGQGRPVGWGPLNVSEAFGGTGGAGGDVFHRSRRENNDEEDLKWAALERLPTYDRLKKGILNRVMDDGKVVSEEVDVAHLGMEDRNFLMQKILKVVEEDHERFLRRLRARVDRGLLEKVKIFPSTKRVVNILEGISGIVRPSRMTLLLGPPGSGKTTLLKTLAGVPDKELRVSGKITYCGHKMSEFVPQRTCVYISQHDVHLGEMTVRETLDFAGRTVGIGSRYELLAELSRREKQQGIKPDPEIDAFMKATAMAGRKSNVVTDCVLKILGMDVCADIIVGDAMRRGISGGQKKRLTSGEMLVGTAKVFYMDEISTGLDSSTTFQIVKSMGEMVHVMDVTMMISLLQPAPETFELFDDIVLLSEGTIVYQGPRENVLEFFENLGFRCPERKGVADFLQEVTSMKDQEQYWFKRDQPYKYITVAEFAEHFSYFHISRTMVDDLGVPYDKSRTHPAALVKNKYGISSKDLLKACLSREWLLMKRSSFLYLFKTTEITIMSIISFTVFFRTKMKSGQLVDGGKFYGALFFSLLNVMFNGTTELGLTVLRLPVFFKQRDSLFFPAWAFALPIYLLKIPISIMESTIWVVLTYFTIGFAPSASRFFGQLLAFIALHQMALSLFRLMAAIGRTQVVTNTLGTFALLLVFVLGGFIIAKDDIYPWMMWGYYISPMMYGQNAIAINEFLDERWSTPNTDPRFPQPTVGKVLLASRGMFQTEYMYWICVLALFGFSILFNLCFVLALKYLNPYSSSKSIIVEEDKKGVDRASQSPNEKEVSGEETASKKKGMVLPFQPLSLAFNNVNYFVDMPSEMKKQGVEGDRLQLLRDISGSFRPGILTALVGVSGAGKTTLMDVLAGRKTGGYIEGNITISGHPKNQTTFARVSGYCEQNDIHSPYVTVYESLVYSAWLRLSPDIKQNTRKMFVEEVMQLVELNLLRDSLVGLPGIDGLSTEQRKRLTIAVELVANPSIIFMDEPTSGLDARAAAIVMRTVRNTVDTGRTVVCTIHQPSIDIFEAFDELLLMKRGGRVIYAGPLGHQSRLLVEYFESIQGVPKIKEGINPATWMLEVSTPTIEAKLNVDFADIYANSDVYRKGQDTIKEISTPPTGSKDLHFPTKYAQSFITQCQACFWKQNLSYWRHSQYNAVRLAMTVIIGIIFGVIFFGKGDKFSKQQDLMNILGAMYAAILFLGGTNTSSVQSVVSVERTVFYREKAAGMFSPLPYAFAQVAIETIYVAIQTFLYSVILFTMIGFRFEVTKFLWFYYYVFMCFLYFTLYGMMLVALTPNYAIAAITMSFFLNFWNLFSGFLIPRTAIPIWWRWYYWCSPVAWTIYGLVTSQIGDMTEPVQVPGLGDIPLKTYIKGYLGYEYHFLPVVAVVHVGWAILFCFIFAYAIKFLNYQNR